MWCCRHTFTTDILHRIQQPDGLVVCQCSRFRLMLLCIVREMFRHIGRRTELVIFAGAGIELVKSWCCLHTRCPGRIFRQIHSCDLAIPDREPVHTGNIFTGVDRTLCRCHVDTLDIVGEAACTIRLERQLLAPGVFELQTVDVGRELLFQVCRCLDLRRSHPRSRHVVLRSIRRAVGLSLSSCLWLHNRSRSHRQHLATDSDFRRHVLTGRHGNHVLLIACRRHHHLCPLMRIIDTIEHPLIRHIRMIQIRDWAVIHRTEDIVPFISSPNLLQIRLIVPAVARSAKQCRQCAARTCTIRDDLLRITGWQAILIVAQIANRGLVINDQRRRLAYILTLRIGRRTATDSRSSHDIAARQCHQRSIGTAAHPVLTARLTDIPRHIAANTIRQEYRRSPGRIPIYGPLLEVGFRNKDAHRLCRCSSRMSHIDDITVSPIFDCLAIQLLTFLGIFR